MRVLHVLAGSAHGGVETAFADTCIALSGADIELAVVARANNAARITAMRQSGIAVATLPFGGPLDVYTPWRLARIIDAFQPDIVQTWMSRAAQKMPRPANARYLVVSRLGGYYKLKYFSAADYFVAITEDIRRHLVAGGVPATRVRRINNFANVVPSQAPADRNEIGTPAGVPLLLALGRLHHAKALDVLIDAMVRLPGVHLWIAGEGPERAALARQIAALKLEDRVRLLGWRHDRTALLKAADICVFPSRYEPFGTVFVEAWAHRVPLVVADAAGPTQFVRNGEDGLVVPKESATALADAVRRLLESAGLAKKLSAAGFLRYQADFSKQRTVAAYMRFYRAILHDHARRPRLEGGLAAPPAMVTHDDVSATY